MNKNVFCVAVLIIISLLLFACSNEKKRIITKSKIEGTIKEIQIDHVIKMREGCRVKAIYFIVELRNISSEKTEIRPSFFVDYCQRDIDFTNTYWAAKGNKFPLAVNIEDSLISIQPKEVRQIKLKGMFDLFGQSLKTINEYYKPTFESDFIILYKHGLDSLIFKKSNIFKVNLFLDDTLVIPTDSIKYNRSLPGPPSENKVLNIEASTKEPK